MKRKNYISDKVGLSQSDTDVLFDNLLKNQFLGINYDGYELYLFEEHMLWKPDFHHDNKVKIAREASKVLRNGQNIYIDAGSTTHEFVKVLCEKITARNVSQLNIVAAAVEQANMISQCCLNMGFDDFSGIKLYIAGGSIRHSTQTISPLLPSKERFTGIISEIGRFDIAILGINGVNSKGELTTQDTIEIYGKYEAIASSKRILFICDDSKFGITEEILISNLSNNVELITNRNDDNVALMDIYEEFSEKITFAR